jgi:N utilization substance protein B
MGKRSTGRKLAVNIIYQIDIQKEKNIKQLLELYYSQHPTSEEAREFASNLLTPTLDNIKEIDDIIEKNCIDWKFSRLPLIDKAILRIAVCELLFIKENSKNVVINEAIEIAKKYSDEKSSKFVNGILDTIAKKN